MSFETRTSNNINAPPASLGTGSDQQLQLIVQRRTGDLVSHRTSCRLDTGSSQRILTVSGDQNTLGNRVGQTYQWLYFLP